jgi:Raf kinase inhibitor-like YbhB/YbcL family protein
MRSWLWGPALCGVLLAAAGPTTASAFTVSAPDFADGSTIPMVHVFNEDGCTGGNKSPAVSWSGAPAGTQSFAITMYDSNAPTGSGWWHWTVFNIPPTVHSLKAGAGDVGSTSLPAGAVQGRTDFGFSHYGGPCPPVGDPPHHYEITVFAVKAAKLPLNAQSSGALVGFLLHFNTLAKAQTVGTFGREK